MLSTGRFTERFDRCLRIISDMSCELEQTSLDAVFTTDAKGIVTSCSQGASEILGISPSEAIGKKVGTFIRGGIPKRIRLWNISQNRDAFAITLRSLLLLVDEKLGRIVGFSDSQPHRQHSRHDWCGS